MTVIFFSASPHLCDCDYLFLSAFISLVYCYRFSVTHSFVYVLLCHNSIFFLHPFPTFPTFVVLSSFHLLSSSLSFLYLLLSLQSVCFLHPCTPFPTCCSSIRLLSSSLSFLVLLLSLQSVCFLHLSPFSTCCSLFNPFAFFISILSLLLLYCLHSIWLLHPCTPLSNCCSVFNPFAFSIACRLVLSLLLFVSFTPGFKFVTQFPHFYLTLIIANVFPSENTSSNLCARPLAQPKTSQFKIGIFR